MKRTADFLSFFASILTLLCISASSQPASSGGGELSFSKGVFQQPARVKYSCQQTSLQLYLQIILTLQMDGSFSELINLPTVFSKVRVAIIAQLKQFKSFFYPQNFDVYGKTSKESIIDV